MTEDSDFISSGRKEMKRERQSLCLEWTKRKEKAWGRENGFVCEATVVQRAFSVKRLIRKSQDSQSAHLCDCHPCRSARLDLPSKNKRQLYHLMDHTRNDTRIGSCLVPD